MTINWVKNHCWLRTHTQLFKFIGQHKGKLVFVLDYYNSDEFYFTIKEVNQMIKCGEWRQIIM